MTTQRLRLAPAAEARMRTARPALTPPPGITWTATPRDAHLLDAIAARATATRGVAERVLTALLRATPGAPRHRPNLDTNRAARANVQRQIRLDVTTVHLNAAPLDLERLLAAPPADFASDILGMIDALDRTTGQLITAWRPTTARTAVHNPEQP